MCIDEDRDALKTFIRNPLSASLGQFASEAVQSKNKHGEWKRAELKMDLFAQVLPLLK